MTTYHSSSSVFMANNTTNGAKKHCESAEPESRQTAKMFFCQWADTKYLRHKFKSGTSKST